MYCADDPLTLHPPCKKDEACVESKVLQENSNDTISCNINYKLNSSDKVESEYIHAEPSICKETTTYELNERLQKTFVLTNDFSSDEDIENFTIEEIRFEDDV